MGEGDGGVKVMRLGDEWTGGRVGHKVKCKGANRSRAPVQRWKGEEAGVGCREIRGSAKVQKWKRAKVMGRDVTPWRPLGIIKA